MRGVKHVDNRRYGQKVILHKATAVRGSERKKHSSRTLFDLLAAAHTRTQLDPIYIYAAPRAKFIGRPWERAACVRLANCAKCRHDSRNAPFFSSGTYKRAAACSRNLHTKKQTEQGRSIFEKEYSEIFLFSQITQRIGNF